VQLLAPRTHKGTTVKTLIIERTRI
jgi:hypothetical protein